MFHRSVTAAASAASIRTRTASNILLRNNQRSSVAVVVRNKPMRGQGSLRYRSSTGGTPPTPAAPGGPGGKKFETEAELKAYLHEANATMQKYHETREMMKRGKLPSKKNGASNSSSSTTLAQGGIFVLFLSAFLAMPFLGKRIAQDEEFKQKYVPSWYDFTVKKPEKPWTRQELHEQMLEVQRDLRERAIAGDFTPEKLEELRKSMQAEAFGHLHERAAAQNAADGKTGAAARPIPKEWDRVHPGLDDDDE